MKRNSKGFTLIELLIVVAIIGIIVAIAIPNLLNAIQRAKQRRSMGDIRTGEPGTPPAAKKTTPSAKKAPLKKAPAKKAPVKKTAATSTARKAPAKKASATTAAGTPAKKAPAKKAAGKASPKTSQT